MIRKKSLIISASLALLVLSGCGRTVEERTDEAMESARDAFEMNHKQPNENVDGLEFYKPVGWKADVQKQEHTFMISKRSQTYVADYDVNAKQDSHAYYDLLMADTSKKVTQQETFAGSDAFGFVVVMEHGENSVEVVTGAGPVQITAIVERGNLVESTQRMMEISRSVQVNPH